jgi:hypothetical protein
MSNALSRRSHTIAPVLLGLFALFAAPATPWAGEAEQRASLQTPLEIAQTREALTAGGLFDPTPDRASAPWNSSEQHRGGDRDPSRNSLDRDAR